VQLEATHRAGIVLGADDALHRTDTAARDPALSPRLHNPDLAPTKAEGRTWGRYSIFALWTNDVHNIANYSFAIGLFALGLSGWQMLASLAIGAVLVYCFMNLTGYMVQRDDAVLLAARRGRRGQRVLADGRSQTAIRGALGRTHRGRLRPTLNAAYGVHR
jgi:hypothetical protein